MQRFLAIFILVPFTLITAACLSPYQQKIEQGNKISDSSLSQLKLGMSKLEVQTILGNPLLKDPFARDRWDYFYGAGTTAKRSMTHKNITLLFSDNRLSEVAGDITFADVEALGDAPINESTGGSIITKPTQKKKGIFNR